MTFTHLPLNPLCSLKATHHFQGHVFLTFKSFRLAVLHVSHINIIPLIFPLTLNER